MCSHIVRRFSMSTLVTCIGRTASWNEIDDIDFQPRSDGPGLATCRRNRKKANCFASMLSTPRQWSRGRLCVWCKDWLFEVTLTMVITLHHGFSASIVCTIHWVMSVKETFPVNILGHSDLHTKSSFKTNHVMKKTLRDFSYILHVIRPINDRLLCEAFL